jgi:hypothetical protein
MATLLAGLDAAEHGQGFFFAIAGEPGISRILVHARARAHLSDLRDHDG